MSRHVDIGSAELEPYDLEADDIIEGTPATAELSVTTIGETEIGIWEITPGIVRDVEKDEAFVVLSGRGTVTFDTGEVIELGPGSLVRLHAGEQTVWKIEATLRKVYVV